MYIYFIIISEQNVLGSVLILHALLFVFCDMLIKGESSVLYDMLTVVFLNFNSRWQPRTPNMAPFSAPPPPQIGFGSISFFCAQFRRLVERPTLPATLIQNENRVQMRIRIFYLYSPSSTGLLTSLPGQTKIAPIFWISLK
jgi:hypothetical protein